MDPAFKHTYINYNNETDSQHKVCALNYNKKQNILKIQKRKQFLQKMEGIQANIRDFINSLGNIKNERIIIADYKVSDNIKKLCQDLNAQKMLQIMENSIRKMNNKKKKKNWNQEDIVVLIWFIQKYNLINKKSVVDYNQSDWKFISQLMQSKNFQQCMFKSLNLLKINDKINPWTQNQDQILRNLVIKSQDHCSWKQISKQLYLYQNQNLKIFRSAKKCRQRWQCFLNPKIKKGVWTSEQDFILIKNAYQIGKKWSQIAKLLKCRTQNAIKNRYQLLCEKYRKQKGNFLLSENDFLNYHMNKFRLQKQVKNINKYGIHEQIYHSNPQFREQQFISKMNYESQYECSKFQIQIIKLTSHYFYDQNKQIIENNEDSMELAYHLSSDENNFEQKIM